MRKSGTLLIVGAFPLGMGLLRTLSAEASPGMADDQFSSRAVLAGSFACGPNYRP